MKVEIAEKAGFCFGVKRAIALAEECAERNGGAKTLGALIHNETVTNALCEKGIAIAASPDEAAGQALVIRSHGVPESVLQSAKAICREVVDATCPFVAKIQQIAAQMPTDGLLLVLGDKNHPEVLGILGHCRCECFAAEDIREMREFLAKKQEAPPKSTVLVVQTTFDRGRFTQYSRQLREEFPFINIHDTICAATTERQQNAEALAKRAMLMVVVGGRHSSNTKKLAELCAKHCKTISAESAADIPSNCLYGLPPEGVIGIAAGASTPDHTIKEVHSKMNEEISKTIENNEEDFASLLEQDQSFTRLYTGKRVKATVVSVSKKEAVVEVGAKQTGYIVREELTNDPNAEVEDIVKPGDVIDAVVIKVDDSVGTAALSKKRVDAALGLEKLAAIKEANETVEAKVSQAVKGGVIAIYENTRVFIPASQTGVPRSGKLEDLVGKDVKFKIIEVSDQRGGRVVGSIRQAARELRDAERAKFWETVEVGQKFEGEVRSIEDYGVFVDIGPVDGLVRTAELTWNRIGHPKDIVKFGDKITVFVKSYDPEKKRVSLSAKNPDDDPWKKFVSEYAMDDVIKVTIVSITSFGAFAQIIPGVDGLIHISQISTERVTNVASVLSVGQEVDAKITDIDEENKRVSLSIKALLEGEEEADADIPEDEE